MRRWGAVVCLAAAACARAAPTPGPTGQLAEAHVPVSARVDPTVHGARLVPESIELSKTSMDPSGMAQGLLQGVRFQSRVRGTLSTSDEWIEEPSATLALPPRLGGGVLFVIGSVVYRADDWLAHARPILRGSPPIDSLFVGLDRVYARLNTGAHLGFDPRSGSVLDLGPWPLDPVVGDYVALDGWRAVALTNVRGAVGTTDAGRTWVDLDVPIRGRAAVGVRHDPERDGWTVVAAGAVPEAVVLSDAPIPTKAVARRGRMATPPKSRCYLVSGELAVSELESCESVAEEGPRGEPHASLEAPMLRAAVVDGWPLSEGSLLLATDGNLVRVSLADGSLLETLTTSFGADLGRCHAVSLARQAAPSAFGFVCGAPSGPTVLFAYDDAAGRLRPLRRFATPRLVMAVGNGSWLARGSCGDPAKRGLVCVGEPSTAAGDAAYAWRDARVEDAPGSAIAVNAQGEILEADPPGLEGARLVVDKRDGTTEVVPLRVRESTAPTRRFLARAMWQGGLEERSPGVLSGWLTAEGTVVGAQIDEAGEVRLGAYIRDLGSPFVAGRYGVGLARTQRGYETTDGGMTWTTFRAPLPIAPSSVRACGPAGCVADGWIRVGWGAQGHAPESPSIFPPQRGRSVPRLSLTCRAVETPALRPHAVGGKSPQLERRPPFSLFGPSGAWLPSSVANLLRIPDRTDDWFKPPALARAESFVKVDAFRGRDTGPQLGPLGRVYAWGPSSGDWSGVGRWVARWRSPFSGASGVVSSAVAPAPFHDLESARAEFGHIGSHAWSATVSEDSVHAIFVTHPSGRPSELTAIDERGALSPVVRVDGEPWGIIDSALRVGSDWYIASPVDAQRDRVDLFRADAGGARRFATVERRLFGLAPEPVRLARSEAGSMVGLLVDGEPSFDRAIVRRWVVPIRVESGAVLPPEPVGAADLGDRDGAAVCTDGAGSGWVIEAPWPDANVTIDLGSSVAPAVLHAVLARFRVSSDRVCVDRLAADISEESLEALLSSASTEPRRTAPADEPTLPMVVVTDEPVALRCTREQNAGVPSATQK